MGITRWCHGYGDRRGDGPHLYFCSPSDEGKTFKVRVTFTDDLGNSESVTSAATAKVVAADAGICGRTPVVIDELVWFADTNDCALVTDEDLAGINRLDLVLLGIYQYRYPPHPESTPSKLAISRASPIWRG